MVFRGKDGLHLTVGMGPNLRGPSQKRGLGLGFVGPVIRRHMRGQGAMTIGYGGLGMHRNPLMVVEHFNQRLADFDAHLASSKPIGHRVIVALNFQVIVQIHLGLFPPGQDKGHRG